MGIVNTRIYRIMIPPEHLQNHGEPRTWSREIAQAHFDWFLSVRETRINNLLEFFDSHRPQRGSEHEFLLGIGMNMAETMCREPNFRDTFGKKELTAPGLAMAYDMAVLVAELIIDSAEGVVQWKLQKKRPTSLEFNLPVLAGRPLQFVFEPVRGSLMDAKAILRGEESGDAWSRTYSFWLNRLTSEAVHPVRN